ncbi:MAG: hypothetical protein K0R57_3321 [Paenibacillaceae bacterium]|nr:hypothetical protein [Paenibacillaceae bacterium]
MLLLRRGVDLFSFWFGRKGLMTSFMLRTLFWVNALGTVYGFYWYWGQLEYTVAQHPLWMTVLVPDSPTASLFFTAAIWWLYKDPEHRLGGPGIRSVRSFIEAFAVVTSFKYGIWAVAMIFAGAAQGNPVDWQDYMLTASHLGMAAEALLYASLFRIGLKPLAVVACWTIFNDFADYGFGIYPGLPRVLGDDLIIIQIFTILLSLVSLGIAWRLSGLFRRSKV